MTVPRVAKVAIAAHLYSFVDATISPWCCASSLSSKKKRVPPPQGASCPHLPLPSLALHRFFFFTCHGVRARFVTPSYPPRLPLLSSPHLPPLPPMSFSTLQGNGKRKPASERVLFLFVVIACAFCAVA